MDRGVSDKIQPPHLKSGAGEGNNVLPPQGANHGGGGRSLDSPNKS